MNDPLDFLASGNEIETLIRAAKGYVRPSDDLRPRVLENVRVKCIERQVARRFWQTAAIVLLCGSLAGSFLREQESIEEFAQPMMTSAVPLTAADAATRSGDASWQMVESFTQLRLRQARLLRM